LASTSRAARGAGRARRQCPSEALRPEGRRRFALLSFCLFARTTDVVALPLHGEKTWPICLTTPWACAASSSSSSHPPPPMCWSRCLKSWVSVLLRNTAPRMWCSTARATSISSSTASRAALRAISLQSTVRALAPWRSVCVMRTKPMRVPWSRGPSRLTCPPARWNCVCRPSRALAVRRCT